MHKQFILATTALAGTLVALPQATYAQDAAAPAARAGLEDIVVTARKVEENIQTTPVAVTALGAEAIERNQIINIADAQRTTPSLTIARGSASTAGFAFVSIRGQGNLTPIIANDPAVATYIDGVYISRPAQGLTDLQDLERLEVLRGPQGTLFGRNTTGGAINIISKDPTDRFEGEVSGKVGNRANKEIGAIVNIPLAEGLAARATYNFRNISDGAGTNRALNRPLANVKSHFARGKLKYEGNGFDITLSADYNKMTNNGQLISLSGYNQPFYEQVFTAPVFAAAFKPALDQALHTKADWYANYAGGVTRPGASAAAIFAQLPSNVQDMYDSETFDNLKTYGFASTINAELGSLNLKSITSYRYLKTDALNDTDGTVAPLLATFGGSKSKSYSQEFQISGDVTDRLSFITGAYWSRETGYEYSRSQIFGGLLRNSIGDAKNITKGLYAQAYYQFTDKLRAVGGFRYTWDTRNTYLHNRQVLGLPNDFVLPPVGTPGAPATSATGFNCTNNNIVPGSANAAAMAAECNQVQKAKFDYPAWTAGIDYQATDDLFLYAKTSGAAKAGGWNIRAGALPAFKPEKVKDVEAGIKATWLDNRLRTNIAGFHTWKSDNQAVVNAVVPGVGVTQFIQNNGSTRVWGAEFEVIAVPWEGMEITSSLSLMDGKYKKGSFSEVQVVNGQEVTVDLSDLPLIQLPKTQFSVGATQTVPMGDGEWSFHADYSYISSQHFNVGKPADGQSDAVKEQYAIENALNKISGYGLVNARIAYKLDNPNIEMSIFGRNLTGKKYLVRRFADLYRQIGFAAEYAGDPMTWGIGLTWKFGQD